VLIIQNHAPATQFYEFIPISQTLIGAGANGAVGAIHDIVGIASSKER
jgi:hypothetical protein